jgi:hypothetical protein
MGPVNQFEVSILLFEILNFALALYVLSSEEDKPLDIHRMHFLCT